MKGQVVIEVVPIHTQIKNFAEMSSSSSKGSNGKSNIAHADIEKQPTHEAFVASPLTPPKTLGAGVSPFDFIFVTHTDFHSQHLQSASLQQP